MHVRWPLACVDAHHQKAPQHRASTHSLSLTSGQRDFRGHAAFSMCFGACSRSLKSGIGPFVATESMILREPSLLHESTVRASVMMSLNGPSLLPASAPLPSFAAQQSSSRCGVVPSARQLLDAGVVEAVQRLVREHPGPRLLEGSRRTPSSQRPSSGKSKTPVSSKVGPWSAAPPPVGLSTSAAEGPTRARVQYRLPFT
jgi:hypothetical protein